MEFAILMIGVLTQYAEAVAAEDVETDSGIWKAFSDFMDKVGIAVGDSEAPKSRKTVRRRNAPGGNKRAKKQPSRRQRFVLSRDASLSTVSSHHTLALQTQGSGLGHTLIRRRRN